MTKSEYINELVEEVISLATDYGENPSNRNEEALAAATEMLYSALDLLIE
jgi:hypothetical protein